MARKPRMPVTLVFANRTARIVWAVQERLALANFREAAAQVHAERKQGWKTANTGRNGSRLWKHARFSPFSRCALQFPVSLPKQGEDLPPVAGKLYLPPDGDRFAPRQGMAARLSASAGRASRPATRKTSAASAQASSLF